jgi:hypothetical protein
VIPTDERAVSAETAAAALPLAGDVALSVIVVNWNTKELLRRCLKTLQRASAGLKGHIEILVVDNASTDGSPDMIRDEFDQVVLVTNDHNIGFARANNQALAAARGEYLMLLNPDTELNPEALSRLVTFMRLHAAVGAAGPRLSNPDGTLQVSCSRTPTIVREFWRLFHLERLYPLAAYPRSLWDSDHELEVEVVQGACIVLRRRALEDVGLLDEDFFMYTEETDLCYRLTKAGWQISWVPWASVLHHGGQSTKQAPRAMFIELYASKVQFFRKHYGGAATMGYKLVLGLASVARIALAPVGYLLDRATGGSRSLLAQHYSALLRSLPAM